MRTTEESNAINRVLKAHGMGTLEDQGVVEALARRVEDHSHLLELLRACDPTLRRDMYECMRPYLRFRAWPLESYEIAAKEYAAAAQLPTTDEAGHLQPYSMPEVVIEVPETEILAICHKCEKAGVFYGERKVDAIQSMRHAGWAWDEMGQSHLCSECLDAMDAQAS